jgi:hypothetical protein
MATITSAQSGDFSDTNTWVGGVVPTSGDDAVAATGHTVVIDVDTTVDKVTQAGTGKFTLGNGRTLTANVEANAGTFTSGGTVDVTATTSATINGNLTGVSSTAVNIAGVVMTGSGTLTINGSITGSAGNATSAANGHAGLYTNVTCTLNVNGALQGGSGNFKPAIRFGSSSNATSNLIGSVTAAANSPGLFIEGNGVTANVTGAVLGNGNTGVAILVSGTSALVNVTGDVTAGNVTFAYGISLTGSGSSTTVVGNVTAGGVAATNGIIGTGASNVITVTGIVLATSSASNHAIFTNGASSTVNIVGSAVGSSTLSHGVRCDATANGVIFQGDMTDSTSGAVAVYTRIFRMTATNSGVTQYANTVGYPTGTPVSRVSPDNVTGMAQEADVRLNTIYGYNNELEGTLAVPPANSVASGVPVDNTVGTAALALGDVAALVGAQVAAAVSNPSVV